MNRIQSGRETILTIIKNMIIRYAQSKRLMTKNLGEIVMRCDKFIFPSTGFIEPSWQTYSKLAI